MYYYLYSKKYARPNAYQITQSPQIPDAPSDPLTSSVFLLDRNRTLSRSILSTCSISISPQNEDTRPYFVPSPNIRARLHDHFNFHLSPQNEDPFRGSLFYSPPKTRPHGYYQLTIAPSLDNDSFMGSLLYCPPKIRPYDYYQLTITPPLDDNFIPPPQVDAPYINFAWDMSVRIQTSFVYNIQNSSSDSGESVQNHNFYVPSLSKKQLSFIYQLNPHPQEAEYIGQSLLYYPSRRLSTFDYNVTVSPADINESVRGLDFSGDMRRNRANRIQQLFRVIASIDSNFVPPIIDDPSRGYIDVPDRRLRQLLRVLYSIDYMPITDKETEFITSYSKTDIQALLRRQGWFGRI